MIVPAGGQADLAAVVRDECAQLAFKVVGSQGRVDRVAAEGGHGGRGRDHARVAHGQDGVLGHGLPLGLVAQAEAAGVDEAERLAVGVEGALVEEAAHGPVGVLEDELLVHGRRVRVEVDVDVAVGGERLPEDDLLVVVGERDHPGVRLVAAALGAHGHVRVQAEAEQEVAEEERVVGVVAAVARQEGVQVQPVVGGVGERRRLRPAEVDEADEAGGVARRVEQAAGAHRTHVAADQAVRAQLVLREDLDQAVLVVATDLQVLLPPLLRVD